MRSSRKRPPKQPCPFGPLDSEIEDLSTFSEVAFREGWLRDSRTGASSRDGVPVLPGLLGASWAPGFTGTFRWSAAPPWKPGSETFSSSSSHRRTGDAGIGFRRSAAAFHPGSSLAGPADGALRLVPRHIGNHAEAWCFCEESMLPGASTPLVRLDSGSGCSCELRGPGSSSPVESDSSWTACAARSPSRDDRESRENHTGGFLSRSKPLLRRGGHWRSPGLRVESPTLQNLIGTSKNAPRS